MATITKDPGELKTFNNSRLFQRYYTLYVLFKQGSLLFQEEFDSVLETLRDMPREKKRGVYSIMRKRMVEQAEKGNLERAIHMRGALDHYHAFVLD